MFRFTLLTLFFMAASAQSDIRALTSEIRQMQADFDVNAFQFNFAGIDVNAELAQEKCPDEWSALVSCVIQTCPNFMDVCPEIEVPEENIGTAPPADGAPADEVTAEAATEGGAAGVVGATGEIVGNMTDIMPEDVAGEAEAIADGAAAAVDGTATAIATDVEVPSCEEIEQSFCESFGSEDLTDCCLLDCTNQIQSLVNCLVLATTGEDRSDCAIPVCPTSAPATSSNGGSETEGSSTSGAVSVVSRVAALTASFLAFVML